MTNTFDLSCPTCHGGDLDIQALVWVRLTEDGTDADASHDGGHHSNRDSWFLCRYCARQGRVSGLKEGKSNG
jgi:hypothetical protein